MNVRQYKGEPGHRLGTCYGKGVEIITTIIIIATNSSFGFEARCFLSTLLISSYLILRKFL